MHVKFLLCGEGIAWGFASYLKAQGETQTRKEKKTFS